MRRRDVIALIAGTAAGCLAIRARAQPSKTFQLDILENTRNTDVDKLLEILSTATSISCGSTAIR
jgi:hypothetical protein